MRTASPESDVTPASATRAYVSAHPISWIFTVPVCLYIPRVVWLSAAITIPSSQTIPAKSVIFRSTIRRGFLGFGRAFPKLLLQRIMQLNGFVKDISPGGGVPRTGDWQEMGRRLSYWRSD